MRPQSSGDTPQPPCRSPRYHHPGRLTAPSFRTTLAALKSRLTRSRAGRRTRRGCLTHQGVGARSGPTTSVRSVVQNVNQNSRSTSEFEAPRVTTPVPGLRPERVAPSGQLNDPPRREMAAQHLPLLAHVRVLTPYGPDLGRGICAPALGAGGLTIPRTPICVSPGALRSGRDEVSAFLPRLRRLRDACATVRFPVPPLYT